MKKKHAGADRMYFKDWLVYYEKILHEFRYSKSMDERAAKTLSQILAQYRDEKKIKSTLRKLAAILKDADVYVFGGATTQQSLKKIDMKDKVCIAADCATTELLKANILPQVIVTDLDGKIDDLLRANRSGAIAVVHAHGDNIKKLEQYAHRFEGELIATTQSEPLPTVYNFGGFTDGDRAVFLAVHFKARSITLVGFDFNKPLGKRMPKSKELIKTKKLKWAERLINLMPRNIKILQINS